MGKMWYTALQEDDEVAQKYKAVGSQHKAQQSFRKAWAQKEFKAVQEQLTHTTSSSDISTKTGKPCNFAQLCWELKSKTAAANYASESLRRHSAGETFAGRPWVAFDTWSKFVRFTYTEELWTLATSQTWTIHKQVQQKVGNSSTSSQQQGLQQPPQQQQAIDNGPAATHKQQQEEPQVKAVSTKGGGDKPAIAKAKAKAASKEKAAATADAQQQEKAARKDIDTSLAKLRPVRLLMCEVSTGLQTLLENIAAGDPWTYAQCEVPAFGELKKALDHSKNASPFWASWSLTGDFKKWSAEVKKQYSMPQLRQELLHVAEVEKRLNDLHLHLRRVHAQHEGRMGIV